MKEKNQEKKHTNKPKVPEDYKSNRDISKIRIIRLFP
jgi:hypothetical protein